MWAEPDFLGIVIRKEKNSSLRKTNKKKHFVYDVVFPHR